MVRERADNVNSSGGAANDPALDFGNFSELYSKPGTVLAGDAGVHSDNTSGSHGEQLAGELSQTWGPESRTAEAIPPNQAGERTTAGLPGLDILGQERTQITDTGADPSTTDSEAAEMSPDSKNAIASAARLAYNPDMATKLDRAFDRIAQG
jgi:hypothetical protein